MGSNRRLERHQSSGARHGPGEAGIVIVPARDKRAIVTHPTIADLRGYLREIRYTYWDGVEGGLADPFVLAIHRMSDFAKINHVEQGPDPFEFRSVAWEGAVALCLVDRREVRTKPAKPPIYEVLLATGSEVQRHLVLNRTETDVIDMIRVDPSCRERLERENPGLRQVLLDYPRLLTNEGI